MDPAQCAQRAKMWTKPHSSAQNYGMDVFKCLLEKKFNSAHVREKFL